MGRRNNLVDMTVREQIAEIKDEFCTERCKYNELAWKKLEALAGVEPSVKKPLEGAVLEEIRHHCESCPLKRL